MSGPSSSMETKNPNVVPIESLSLKLHNSSNGKMKGKSPNKEEGAHLRQQEKLTEHVKKFFWRCECTNMLENGVHECLGNVWGT